VGHGATLDEAFEALRSHARNNNHKLSTVAQEVVQGAVTPESLLHRKQDL
jgi:AmiR/NasT family two-component response regulator